MAVGHVVEELPQRVPVATLDLALVQEPEEFAGALAPGSEGSPAVAVDVAGQQPRLDETRQETDRNAGIGVVRFRQRRFCFSHFALHKHGRRSERARSYRLFLSTGGTR
jgi:hypothetical protein